MRAITMPNENVVKNIMTLSIKGILGHAMDIIFEGPYKKNIFCTCALSYQNPF
jgi:hypothetical protein